jgi:AraC-like DNA-binding protein
MKQSDKMVQHWRVFPATGLELVRAGMGPCGLGKHFHDTWSVGTILQGECCFRAGGHDHRVASGEVFVIPPFEVHACAAGSKNVVYAVLYVDHAIMRDSAPAVATAFPDQRRRVWRRVGMADDIVRASDDSIEIARVVRWLEEIQAELRTPEDASRAARPHPLRSILDRHWDMDTALCELERQAGLSRYHAIRTFTRDVGVAPGVYLRQLRALKARRLLQAGQAPASVAQALHFADQAHFTRVFKEVHGIPPGRFRRLACAPARTVMQLT